MGAPGVFYEQKELEMVVTGTDSSILGIAGNARWGKADELVGLSGLQKYVQMYGKPVNPTETPVFYQLFGFFKKGKTAYYVRPQGGSLFGGAEIAKGAVPVGISSGLASLPTVPSDTNVAGLYTKYAGVHDEGDIYVEIFDVDDEAGEFGINAGVVLNTGGTALDTGDKWFEEHRVSVITGAKDGYGRSMYIEDVLLRDSQLLAGRAKASALVDDVPIATTTPVKLTQNAYVQATESEILTAYYKFNSLDAVTIDLVTPGSFTDDIINRCIEVVETRGDSFAIVSPAIAETWTAEGISGSASWVAGVTKSAQAAAYAMYFKVTDEYNDTDVYVPAAGYIAGVYAYNDAQGAKWTAPAGPRRGALSGVELAVTWDSSDRDTLYDANINWVANTSRYGIMVEGQKTLYGVTSALNRVNVSRLILQIKRDLMAYLQDYIYELNNERNRTLIYNSVNNYLAEIVSQEGLYDKRVVCDDTNNTATVIDQNKLIVDVGIKPAKVAEFIYLKTTIAATGIDFDTIYSQA